MLHGFLVGAATVDDDLASCEVASFVASKEGEEFADSSGSASVSLARLLRVLDGTGLSGFGQSPSFQPLNCAYASQLWAVHADMTVCVTAHEKRTKTRCA